MSTKFEVGKKYQHGVNYHSYFAEVLERTAKTVTVRYGEMYLDDKEVQQVEYYGDVEKKVIKTNKDGDEYFGSGYGRYWSTEFETPVDRYARYAREKAEKEEAERQARLSVRISGAGNGANLDSQVLMAWAINNNLADLVKYCDSVEMGSCCICADPRYNSRNVILHFKGGFSVGVHDGNDDKYVTYFIDRHTVGERLGVHDEFTIKARFSPCHDMTLTPEGVWLNPDGTEWEPNYEMLND